VVAYTLSSAVSFVASEAVLAGHDPDLASLAFTACAETVAGSPAVFGSARESRKNTRKQRTALKKAACGAIGVTVLGLLINWALGKLVAWLLDRFMPDTFSDPAFAALYGFQPSTAE
jgi:hypothetical protein